MLDSPYVRRVAISLSYMGFAFERKNTSVFRDMAEFSNYNPVLKAPTFITDNNIVLMDSSLILQYLEASDEKTRSLMPKDTDDLGLDLRIIGLALAATDKAIQIEYEEKRPADEQSPSWIKRITAQMLCALSLLEKEYQNITTPWLHGNDMMQADIASVIAFDFANYIAPNLIVKQDYPTLHKNWQRGENLDIFKKYLYR